MPSVPDNSDSAPCGSVSLIKYIDHLYKERQEQMDRRFLHVAEQTANAATGIQRQFDAVDRAIGVARESLEKRLESMNEFRQQLNTQAARFVTREEEQLAHQAIVDKMAAMDKILSSTVRHEEAETAHQALSDRIAAQEKFASNISGKLWALGGMISLLQLILHFLPRILSS